MSYERCPNENQQCKYYPKCYADKHHYYWPKSEYRGRMEHRFREHFVELLCRADHDEHHHLPPPDKPSPDEMRQYLIDQGELKREELYGN